MINYQTIANKVQELLGDEYVVSAKETEKNNGVVRRGVAIGKKDENFRRIIYIDGESIEKDDIDEVAHSVVDGYKNDLVNMRKILSVNAYFFDRKYILENAEYKVIGREKNEEYLKNVPHISCLDMAAIYVVNVDDCGDDYRKTTFTVTHKHMNFFGIKFSELDAAARINTIQHFGIAFEGIEKMMGRLAGLEPESAEGTIEDAVFDDGENQLYVLTNKKKINGAALLMYPELLDEIAEKAGSDLLILPSSIHECIITKFDDTLDVNDLENMVRDINVSVLQDEEILTNSVYKYDRSKRRLVFA